MDELMARGLGQEEEPQNYTNAKTERSSKQNSAKDT